MLVETASWQATLWTAAKALAYKVGNNKHLPHFRLAFV